MTKLDDIKESLKQMPENEAIVREQDILDKVSTEKPVVSIAGYSFKLTPYHYSLLIGVLQAALDARIDAAHLLL